MLIKVWTEKLFKYHYYKMLTKVWTVDTACIDTSKIGFLLSTHLTFANEPN